jgi:hypothetical protein
MATKKARHEEEKMRCICPRCEKQHEMYLFLTGNGQPRKYCPPCKSIVGGTQCSKSAQMVRCRQKKSTVANG